MFLSPLIVYGGQPTPVHRLPEGVVATTIVNARVFDGENMRPWTSVRFEGGVITHCTEQPAVRLGDEVVDADGGTLLPGLIDAHIHLVPGALEQSLTFGVTTVLDMFSKPTQSPPPRTAPPGAEPLMCGPPGSGRRRRVGIHP